MAKMQTYIAADLDPSRPIPEACAVIEALIAHNRIHEEAILQGVKEAVEKRLQKLEELKGADTNGESVRGNNRKQENK
ncbi:hypothetical protein V3851_25990 [Paenibacillus sp. M1]|uniref:Uncharacterized protein n=1 Tax=Paenibacillus haidiansis TaxID=1574488 RepID=A0ABU7W109_9BACL